MIRCELIDDFQNGKLSQGKTSILKGNIVVLNVSSFANSKGGFLLQI